jgi:hypothetical protein
MGSPFDKPIFAPKFLPFVTLPACGSPQAVRGVKRRKIVSPL